LATTQYFNFKTQDYFDRFIIVIRIDLNCCFTSLQFIQFPLSFFTIIHCCLIASYFNPYYSCVVAGAVRNIAFNPWRFDLVFHCCVNSLPLDTTYSCPFNVMHHPFYFSNLVNWLLVALFHNFICCCYYYYYWFPIQQICCVPYSIYIAFFLRGSSNSFVIARTAVTALFGCPIIRRSNTAVPISPSSWCCSGCSPKLKRLRTGNPFFLFFLFLLHAFLTSLTFLFIFKPPFCCNFGPHANFDPVNRYMDVCNFFIYIF